MLNVAVLLLGAVGLSYALRRRPAEQLALILFVRVALPSTAAAALISDSSLLRALQPSTYVLLAVVLVNAFASAYEARPTLFKRGQMRTPLVLLAAAALVGLAETFLSAGPGTSLRMVDAVVVPVILISQVLRLARSDADRLARYFVLLASFAAAIALVQYATKSYGIYEASLRRQSFFSLQREFRPQGSLDSPLDLAFLCCLALPLVVTVGGQVLRYAAAVLLLGGILVSGSRLFALLGLIALLFIVLRSGRGAGQRLMAAVSVGSAALVMARSAVADLLVGRLSDDGGSFLARSDSYTYIRENLSSHLLGGQGFGFSLALKGRSTVASLENGYAMMAFDFGLSVAVVILGAQIALVLSGTKGVPGGAKLSATFALFGAAFFSGVMTASATSLVFAAVIGLAAARYPSSKLHPEEVSPSTRSGRARPLTPASGSLE